MMSTTKRSILVFGILSLIATIVILWIISLVSEFRLNQRQILFEVWHGSVWRDERIQGFFIDSNGDVYTFRNERNDQLNRFFGDNTQRGEPPYTTSNLFQHYGNSSQLAGKVDANTLKEMIRLVQPASVGPVADDDPLTPVNCGSKDAGIYTYVAYLYDSELKKHTPVYLYTMGDFQAVNLSEESRTLHKWLETTCVENGYFSGCNPASSVCRP
jgi:hypothetical protein